MQQMQMAYIQNITILQQQMQQMQMAFEQKMIMMRQQMQQMTQMYQIQIMANYQLQGSSGGVGARIGIEGVPHNTITQTTNYGKDENEQYMFV